MGCLLCEGVGAKKFGMSLENPGKPNFWTGYPQKSASVYKLQTTRFETTRFGNSQKCFVPYQGMCVCVCPPSRCQQMTSRKWPEVLELACLRLAFRFRVFKLVVLENGVFVSLAENIQGVTTYAPPPISGHKAFFR